MTYFNTAVWGILFLITAFKFAQCIRMVPNRKEYIVERLGRYSRTLGPGFHVLIPFFDNVAFIRDLREETMEVPPQECFTADNVKVEVDGVIYISVDNSKSASYGVADYRRAAVSLAQTTTRSVIGTLDLDKTFEERDAISSRVVQVLTEVGHSWGITVHRYEVKNIVPPPSVRDSMERQMSAERERRALLARSEGEKQSRVNGAEGQRMELINRSEGEMRRRINEAEGRAEEILTIAKATAESITTVAQALSHPGGTEAMQLRLSQQLLTQIGGIAKGSSTVLLPLDLTRLDQLLEPIALPRPDGVKPRERAAAPPLTPTTQLPPVHEPAPTPAPQRSARMPGTASPGPLPPLSARLRPDGRPPAEGDE